jgi:hypothetical protein
LIIDDCISPQSTPPLNRRKKAFNPSTICRSYGADGTGKVRRGKTLFVVKEKDYLTPQYDLLDLRGRQRRGRREQIYLCKKTYMDLSELVERSRGRGKGTVLFLVTARKLLYELVRDEVLWRRS